MTTETKTELAEVPEVEVAEVENGADQTLALDQMDAVIAVAGKVESYAKAMDTITGVIIKRAYEGDFVCHDRENVPASERKANIGAAAAERIAAFLGIREENWRDLGKEWSDDHKFFTYSYEADFIFGTRRVHAIGRAGNRDKFFGKSQGEWKPLDEVQEDDIRRAAFRACRKEGVRTLLGLRNIPVERLVTLGLDSKKLKYVNFVDRGRTLSDEAKTTKSDTGMAEKIIIVAAMEAKEGVSKSTNAPWRRLDVKDTDGVNWIMWSSKGSKREAILRDSCESKAEVKIHFQTTKTDRGEQYTILRVNDQVDSNGK